MAELSAVYATGGIVAGVSNLGNELITISDTGSLNADQFQAVNSRSTGIATVTGTVTANGETLSAGVSAGFAVAMAIAL